MKFYNSFLVATLLAGGLSHLAVSQQMPLEWAYNMPGAAGDSGKDIVTDANGNVILLGDFNGTVDFEPGAGITNLTSAGVQDCSISKYDPDGNLIWAVRVGGTGNDAGNSVDVDNAGNVYIAGTFQNTADFDPGLGTANLTTVGLTDAFVLKLDQDGNFVWVKQFGGTSEDAAMSISVDPSGNPVVSGFFRNTSDFDPGVGVANATTVGGSADGFVVKLTSTGNYTWHYVINSANDVDARALITDASGNVYVTGYFAGTADFDFVGTATQLSAGGEDIFVLRITSSGVYVNAVKMGSTGNDSGRSINVDSQGNILVSGYFSGTVDFDPGAGTNNKTSLGGHDIFVQKLNNSLTHIWTSTAGGTSDDQAWSIETDYLDNVFIAGFFRTTVDFNPGPGTANVTVSGGGVFADQFYWKLDANGNYLSADKAGNTNNDHAFAFYPSGNYVYITGYLVGSSNYDFEGGTTTLTSAGSGDIYLVKYYNCNPIHTNDVIVSCGPITWIDGNAYSSDNNTATHTLTSINGCDSTVHLNLMIKPIDDKNAVASETNLCDNGSITVDVENTQVGVFYTLVDQLTSTVLDGPFEGDGGTLTFDAGTISTTTTYEVQAERNKHNALTFLGNSPTPTYVSLGTDINKVLAGTSEITVEAWINTDNSNNLQTVVSTYTGLANTMQFLLRIDQTAGQNKAAFWIGTGTTPGAYMQVAGTTTILPDTWYHLAGTYDGSFIYIYVNGVLENQVAVTTPIPNVTNELRIGGGLDDNTEYFYGDITNVRIWSDARTLTEINDNMTVCVAGSEQGLLAMYNMVDGTGSSTLTDESVNGYDGVLMNMDANTSWNYTNLPSVTCAMCYSTMNEMPKVVVTTISDETVTPDQAAFCDNGTATISTGSSTYGLQYVLRDDSDDSVIDGPLAGDGSSLDFTTGSISTTTSYNVYAESIENSLEFDGVNDYAEITGIDVSGTSFSIEFWGRRNNIDAYDFFMGQGPIGTNTSLHIGFRNTNEFTFAFFNNDLNTPPYTDLDWHHWAMTYDANTNERKIYRDGILVANDIATGDYIGTGNILLGDVSYGGSPINGNIDELRIWDGVRTENQINNNINACLVGDESNLIAYYKFDELSGTSTVTDITSNGYDGTLVNLDLNAAWQAGATTCGCAAEMTDVVTITINNANTGTDVQTACDSYTWIDGITYTADNNSAQFTVTNLAGCDSVVTLNLSIAASPIAGATNNGDGTLSATGTGTYQWIDCGTNTAVSGATSATFVPSANGSYAVIVTSGACDDTSACVAYNSVGLNENATALFTVYPNPTNGFLTVNFGQELSDAYVVITNVLGEQVYAENVSGTTQHELNLNQSNGIYFVNVYTQGNLVSTVRVIKQ